MPVDPKPPEPLKVSSRVVTCETSNNKIFSMISCAILSPEMVVVVVWWCGIIIQNYSDPFTSGNDEIHLAVVEKEDVDVAPVI